MKYVMSVNGESLHDQNAKFSQLLTELFEQASDPQQIHALGGMQVEVAQELAESFSTELDDDLVHVGTVHEEGDLDEDEVAEAESKLKAMKVDDLRNYADESDIDLGDATRKADIIAAILPEEKN